MHASTMRLITLAISATSMLATVASATAIPNTQHYTKRELVARDRLFATLSEDVRLDLEKRDPSTYTLNLDLFMDRDEDEVADGLVRRMDPSGPGDQNCINGQTAMTYDDGPYNFNRQLATEWADAGHQITMFVNVNNFACSYDSPYPENLQYAMSRKHIVSSHTATHPDLTTLTTAQIDEQVQLVENFTYKTLGVVPALIRPPYGSTTDAINAHLREKWGLHVVLWSADSGDADGGQVDDQASIDESIRVDSKAGKQGGAIILNHETHETSVKQVAPAVIASFAQNGVKSVGVGKCLGIPNYKVILHTTPQRDGSWNCDGVPAPGQSSV